MIYLTLTAVYMQHYIQPDDRQRSTIRYSTVQRHREGPDANGATHTERGPGPSNTTLRHKPPHRPEPRPGLIRTGPGTKRSGQHGPETTQGPDKPPEEPQATRTSTPGRAPRPGQLSRKGRDPCRQRDLRPHQASQPAAPTSSVTERGPLWPPPVPRCGPHALCVRGEPASCGRG